MDKKALEIMSDIALKYAQGYIDFTTRQNVQFHYIQIKDLPAIFKAFTNTALTSRLASGDGPRPIVNCPVSGLDKDDIYDVNPIIKELDKFFNDNAGDFSNLPRKYKVGISGCKCHCMGHEIQDVGFTAFNNGEEVLFDLTIGGGVAKSKRIASRAKRFIKPEQVKDVSVVCAEIFREFGNRDNRSKARVRNLVEDWGVEKFVAELEARLNYKLTVGLNEPEITPYQQREHFGVHSSSEAGKSYIGCATNRGRVAGDKFKALSDLVTKYDAGGIALTTTQNFIVYGVNDDILEEFLSGLKELGFTPNPSRFEARTQSCTGLGFCKFAITETKNFTSSLITHLEEKFPNYNKPISIAVSGCTNGCSHPHIADIGLIGTKVKTQEGRVDGYEVYLGGTLHGENGSKFGEKQAEKVPASEIFSYVENLIRKRL
jgi:sulfite reductase (ferredoxin)